MITRMITELIKWKFPLIGIFYCYWTGTGIETCNQYELSEIVLSNLTRSWFLISANHDELSKKATKVLKKSTILNLLLAASDHHFQR